MQTYAVVDSTGVVQDLYGSENNNVPEGAILLSDTDGALLRNSFVGYKIVSGKAVYSPPPIEVVSLAELKLAEAAKAKAAKLIQLQKSSDAATQKSVVYLNHTFQADTDSQMKLLQSTAGTGISAPTFWQNEGNVQVPMTLAQLNGLADVMIAQGLVAFINLQIKKDVVRLASTVAEVDAVAW